MNQLFVAGFAAGLEKDAARRRKDDRKGDKPRFQLTRNQRIIIEEVADHAGMLLRRPGTLKLLRKAIFWTR